ncbi:DUF6443 domain-containing protein [Tenacibaculum amylolyticum]|uniref:DUF6443 domain-containing protein n=1 Tax=Tenacibaculum amylolyticum TaxID=104269 RepID=UPI0038939B88
MKNIKTIFILNLVFFLVCTLKSYAQIRPIISINKTENGIAEISGVNNPNLNDQHVYKVVNIPKGKEEYITSARWFVSGATIIKQTNTSVEIKWTSTGRKVIQYTAYSRIGNIEGTYNVYVNNTNSIPPPTPTKPYISNLTCTNATLTKYLAPFGITWYWQGTNPNGTNTFSQSINLPVNASGRYYLRARNSNGIWSTNSSYVDVTLGTAKTWYADTDGDNLGDPNTTIVQCEQPQGYVSNNNDQCPNQNGNGSATGCPACIQTTWYADTDGDNLGDPNTTKEACDQPLGYVANSNDQCPTVHGGISATGCPIPLALSNENYIYTVKPQIPTTNTANLTEDKDVIRSITYFDGLGRPQQNIGIKQSPTGDDIVTHTEYDDFGRQTKEYLPYPTVGNGTLKTNTITSTNNYYTANYGADINTNTPNPYSEKSFENSPLHRVEKQAAPGYNWRLGSGHEIEFDYETNATNEVKLYNVTTELTVKIYEPNLVDAGTYTAGELFKTITKDENHNSSTSKLHTTEEFKNKQGQIVLKRTYALVNNKEEPHDTYYVYDDYGNLSYVLPPKVTTIDGISDNELNELCYQYVYDYRNRLARKKIPGKDWEYIVYNRLDQPTITQDGNLRSENKWIFTKYDQFGRVIYTGKWSNAQSITAIRGHANNPFYKNTEERSGINTVANTELYYTNKALPLSAIEKIFSINYYDTYIDLPAGLSTTVTTSYGQTSTTKTQGLATVSKVRVLKTNHWITTVTYYDEKTRPIYVYSKNDYLNTVDIIESKLDFVGKVLETKTTHQKNGQTAIVAIDKFTYDHAGRVSKQTQKINNQSEEVIVENTYDALGVLIKKGIGGEVNQNRLQSVDFSYNIRGWLKQINNPSNLSNDLFAFAMNYNAVSHNGTALYNGNIAETEWKTANDNTLRWYRYLYDALNRIHSGIDNSGNYSLHNITYDKNGNILTLLRNGHTNEQATSFGTMDNLKYTYDNGNKLIKVEDLANKIYGFKDGVNSAQEYTYDSNGNMLTDFNKALNSPIQYNHLNLPTTIEKQGTLNYVYDAYGNKLEKKLEDVPGGDIITQYAGNFIYRNNELQFFNHSEGYAQLNANGEFEYVYQYKDHLGNLRLSYTDNNKDGIVTQTEIVKESNYYPFGLKHKGYNTIVSSLGNSLAQKFGYNGKELNEELGIQWHDFGARNYDASLGRWMNTDPLADKNYSWTPFRYGYNNPIKFIDPDGNYERDGHYWTVYLAAILVNHNAPATIAYWAEEPDHIMSKAGDIGLATNTWLYPRWQKEVHALTGGFAVNERATSREMYRNAIGYRRQGYALHRLGDSYAHSKDNGRMYPHITGHAADGTAPDKIAKRPELYREYVQDLLNTLGGSNVDTFTFDYITENAGTTDSNSAIFETEIRIREGISNFSVAGDQRESVKNYVEARNKKYNTKTKIKSFTGTAHVFKKNKKGKWVNKGETETRTFFLITE